MELVNAYETIEFVHGAYYHCQGGEYPQGSVLEFQQARFLMESYETLEEAQAAHPEAEVSDAFYMPPRVPDLPPPDFDPTYCGERWDEEL